MTEPAQRFSLVAQRSQQFNELARRMELGEDLDSISKEMGLAVPELQRITATQGFRQFYNQYRNKILATVDQNVASRYDKIIQIQQDMTDAAERMVKILVDIAENSPNDNVRSKIAMYILDHALKLGADTYGNEVKLDAKTIQMLQVVMTENRPQLVTEDYVDADIR